MNTENWIAIKKRDILISADRAGTGFIAPITQPEPGSLASHAVAFLHAVMNRFHAENAMRRTMREAEIYHGEATKALLAMKEAFTEFQEAINMEVSAGLAMAEASKGNPAARYRALEEIGYTAPWSQMYGLALQGENPFLNVCLFIKSGDDITVTTQGNKAVYRIARNGASFDIAYPAGGHLYRDILRTRG